jgi:hypothetical protein
LLLDSRGRALDDAVRVFLPPSTGEFPEMPDWAELKFLNAAMREKLADELKVKEARELQQKLAPFGVMEYSLANLIRALVAEANRRVRQKPDEANQYRSDLLRIVARLFVSESRGNKRPDYPDQSPIYLKTQGGGYAVASSLYLGKGFGPQGEIVQALFEPTAPEKLIDEESLLLFDRDAHALEEFLIWMGVAKWPREMSEKRPHPEYLKHVLTTLRTPARFEDKVIDSCAELDAARVEEVKTIDGLENIILSGEPTAIAAWLATDVRAIGWGRPSRAHAQLHGFPPSTNKARVYQGPLPSYIRWRLETTKWLSDNEGRPLRPKDCVLGERAIEELFPRPFMPDDEILNRLGVSAQDILDGWRNGGVLTSLASIERDEIYAKLLELPHRSPDGKLARPLYHWLLDASDVALGGDGPFQSEFRRRGLMWGKNAAASKYFPINELHHADADGVPDGLLKKLSIVDLRKRVGADKVEKVFGVKPIDRAGILRKVQAKQIAVGSIDANREFQASKPYLHNLRISETRQRGQLQILKDLQLEICSTITVDISFEDLAFTYEIPIWGWIVEDRMLYVRSDPARPLELAGALLSNAISEALASEIFRISDGGDFARILSCKEGDRPELLRRLRGDDALTDIDDIKAEYDEFVDRTAERARFPISEPPTQQLAKDLSVTETMSTEPPPSTSTNEETAKGPAQPPHVLQIDHQPEVTRTREIQITRTVGGERIGPTEYHAADPDFAERKAMEFEESASQGRWPLRVGHIMGGDGPRCDILSFASKEARDMFVTGPERDLGSVVRFIEVKGRTSSGAAIELKGNALAAAETFHERYYIYRLFESPDGYYSLAVLSNPLARKSALRPAVYVGLQQAVETEQFLIVGGIER